MSATDKFILTIKDLHKSYRTTSVLRGIDLEVVNGEVLAIIGRSGSGKSTLLRCIHLLEEFERGEIILDGERLGYQQEGPRRSRLPGRVIARQRASIGMVFQHFGLFPHMTALKNVIEGPIQVKRIPRDEAVKDGMEILERVGMLEKKDAYPPSLSGGQSQRIGIARALAMHPKLLLFDEPTSALDPELVHGILSLMTKIAEARSTTMLVITHELEFARKVASEIVFIDAGVVVERASPDKMLSSPEHPETRRFLESIL